MSIKSDLGSGGRSRESADRKRYEEALREEDPDGCAALEAMVTAAEPEAPALEMTEEEALEERNRLWGREIGTVVQFPPRR